MFWDMGTVPDAIVSEVTQVSTPSSGFGESFSLTVWRFTLALSLVFFVGPAVPCYSNS